MKKILWVIIMSLLLVGCSENFSEQAIKKSTDYIVSMDDGDLKRHYELLEAFEIDKQAYQESFYSHVKDAEVQSCKVSYENDYYIITQLDFTLELDDDFVANEELFNGKHKYTRYLTFAKYKSMELQEIYTKLIK